MILSQQVSNQTLIKSIILSSVYHFNKEVKVILDEEAKKYLLDKGFDEKMGARPLSRVIDNDIKTPISRKLIFEDTAKTSTIDITVEKEELKIQWK